MNSISSQNTPTPPLASVSARPDGTPVTGTDGQGGKPALEEASPQSSMGTIATLQAEAGKHLETSRRNANVQRNLLLEAPATSLGDEHRQKAEKALTTMLQLGTAVGTDIYALMAEFQRSAQQMRNANREIRGAEFDAQISSLMASAEEMKTAADFRMYAGLVQGLSQIAAGATQVYQSGRAAAETVKSANLGKQADEALQTSKLTPELDKKTEFRAESSAFAKEAKIADSESNLRGAKAQAYSGMLNGIGGIASTMLNSYAETHDIAAKRLETEAKLHESSSQGADEMMRQMMDVIRDVRDKLQSIEQSRIETNRAMARNI